MVNAINVVVHVVLYASQFNKRKMAIMVELKFSIWLIYIFRNMLFFCIK